MSPERHDSAAATGPAGGLEELQRTHARIVLFCDVLAAFANDLNQQGREQMARSLFEYATEEVSQILMWEVGELMPRLQRRCGGDGHSRKVFIALVARHRAVAASIAPIADGLETLSRGGFPERPAEFVLDALRFCEAFKRYLEWQDRELVPFAAGALSRRDIASLDATLAWRADDRSKTAH